MVSDWLDTLMPEQVERAMIRPDRSIWQTVTLPRATARQNNAQPRVKKNGRRLSAEPCNVYAELGYLPQLLISPPAE